jgi:crossover junction endodeoxyribonuclease RusA
VSQTIWSLMRKYKEVLELPFPPSVNSCYRSIPRGRICAVILSKDGRAYKDRIKRMLSDNSKLLTDKRLMVSIRLFMPDRRKRDIDNYNKILLDSLTGIVWKDDSQIDILTISRDEIIKGGKAVINIREL